MNAPDVPAAASGDTRFPATAAELERIAGRRARRGARAARPAPDVDVSQGVGQSVTVREGEVETIAYNRDKGVSVIVYVGQRRGHASSADFSDASIRATVDKALAIARYTAEDPCAGLADADRLATRLAGPRPLSSRGTSPSRTRSSSGARPRRPRSPSTGGSPTPRARPCRAASREFVYANSLGFRGGYRSSRHHIDVGIIGEDDDGMQRDYWYTAARAPGDLLRAAEVGRRAGERTVRRLGARSLATTECPVLFEAPEATDLLGAFVHAVSGGSLYRKSSFLLDSLGTRGVRAARVDPRGAAPAARPRQRALRRGRRGDALARRWSRAACCAATSSAATRRASSASQTTGNAGGSHTLVVSHGDDDLPRWCGGWGAGSSSPSSWARASTR